MNAKTQQRLLSFPDPVDDVSARLVAAGVVAMAATAVLADVPWLTCRSPTGSSLAPQRARV